MAFAPNMSVVGLSHSGGITLRDIHNKETVGLLEIPSGAYNTIQFSPDSTKIVARSSEWVRIWDVETQDVLQTKQLDSFFLSMGLNSVSHIVATISYGSPEIQLHDLQTGQVLQTLTDITADEGYTFCLIFSPDNQYIARCVEDGNITSVLIEMWDVANGNVMYTINLPSINWARDMSFDPDGETFAFAVGSGTMMSYNVVTGQLSHQNNFSTDSSPRVRRFTYSPDGHFIAAQGGMSDVGQSAPDVLVFDSYSMAQLISVPTGSDISSFAWHPIEPIIAVGGDDGTIQLVDVTTGNTVQKLYGNGQINDLTFNPDGTLLVSLSENGVTLWDVATGDTLRQLGDSGYPQFTSDGRTLVLLGGNKVSLWQVLE
jgi:WD40 repeat protein